MEDIINIRLEKLMELEIARVRLQCQELVLQKIAGWDDFKNMKYKEVKDEMRNIQPSFNDAQLQKIFEKSCIDMCTDIGSEQDSSGLISEDLKARILEWLNGEFELLSEDIEKFRVILIPIPGETIG
ncbi:hypothetical protein QJS04_geneDACA013659 [Acorus gramineus]|uniref:Uncharacterized protein n=1 Tax=Acorus gramineus TaxID=55184 RepID=A0AAV9AYI4_ACOGR|nr:hypothetical protein QJS04_geneDACA013659 [Acorus gramineus]